MNGPLLQEKVKKFRFIVEHGQKRCLILTFQKNTNCNFNSLLMTSA